MIALLVMSYGAPNDPTEIEDYYTHVRRGRPPTPEALADLQRRYFAIGGVSPLAERTRDQAEGIGAALEHLQPGRWKVVVAAKHSFPFIEDGVSEVVALGIRHLVGLVMAPHYSALSVGEYVDRASTAARMAWVETCFVESWNLLPGLVESLTERLREAIEGLPDDVRGATEVLVTAHSLPTRVVEMGDPYPDQLRQTAEAVCAMAGIDRWQVAWQSAGRTSEPWLGPDILDVLRTLAASGTRAVVVCPAGFTSDHLEVLYDVDIEAVRLAEALGLILVRTESLNADPKLMAALAELVIQASEKAFME